MVTLTDVIVSQVEDILIYCRRELKECVLFLERFELYLSQASRTHDNPKLDIDLLAKRIVEKAIPDSSFQEKRFLFDCLRKKTLPYHESGKEFGSNTWLSRCQELFSSWFTIPRRVLRYRIHHYPGIVRLSQSPGPPAPSYQKSASSPSPILQPSSSVLQTFSPETSFPQDTIHSPPPLAINNPPGRPQTGAPNRNYVLAAIAASSVAGLAFVALLLLCCLKNSKDQVGPRNGQKDEKRDEKPLLNFCSSDVSAGIVSND